MAVDILILGAGWTSTFLITLCDERKISYEATSRSGRDQTIKFSFDPDSDDQEPYAALPDALTVLITFPINVTGASERLVRLYSGSRKGDLKPRFIQLGTTSIWDGGRLQGKDASVQPPAVQHKWYDRHSAYVHTPRAEAEDELLALSPSAHSAVLNLSGLWGGSRSPKNWVGKVAPTKEALKNKGSLHVIHGLDLARCILAVHADFDKAAGQRWLLTDGRIYDWWDLASAWGTPPAVSDSSMSVGVTAEEDRGLQALWVRDLIEETGVHALPRPVEKLGRALDSRDFWKAFGLSPLKARIEH